MTKLSIFSDNEGAFLLRETDFYKKLIDMQLITPYNIKKINENKYAIELFDDIVLTHSHEWNPLMLYDALLLMLQLETHLERNGFGLRRIDPNDIVFVNGKPRFFNVELVEGPKGKRFSTIDQYFERFFFVFQSMNKLAEFSSNRSLLQGVSAELYLKLNGYRGIPNQLNKATQKLYWLKRKTSQLPKEKQLELLLSYSRQIKIKEPPNTYWSNFYGAMGPIEISPTSTPKQKAYDRVLKKLPPQTSTVLDIGCNEGWFSCYAEKCGFKVVSCDYDMPAVFRLYQRVKENGLNILPLCLNVTEAIREFSFTQRSTFHPRFISDVVVVLALSHHLVLQQGLTFPQVVSFFSALCRNTLITDFVPQDDTRLPESYLDKFGNTYNIEYVISLLEKEFTSVKVMESDPYPRKILICTK